MAVPRSVDSGSFCEECCGVHLIGRLSPSIRWRSVSRMCSRSWSYDPGARCSGGRIGLPDSREGNVVSTFSGSERRPRIANSKCRRLLGIIAAVVLLVSTVANCSSQPVRDSLFEGVVRGVSNTGVSYDGLLSDGVTPMTNASPGTYGVDWFHEVDGATRSGDVGGLSFLAGRGWKLDRVSVRWERLQPNLYGELDSAEVRRVTAYLDELDKRGMKAILDLHNYGHYKTAGSPNLTSNHGGWSIGDAELPYSAFTDVWQKIVEQWGAHPAVWGWELMNEPVNMSPGVGVDEQESPEQQAVGVDRWKRASQAAVSAIRSLGADEAILVAGYDWSAMDRWVATNGNPWIQDPLGDPDRLIYVAHHYWGKNRDGLYGGLSPTQVFGSVDAAKAQLVDVEFGSFTRWLERNGVRGAVTEFGWPSAQANSFWAEWNEVAEAWLAHADAHRVHWWYFATGTTWVGSDFQAYQASGHWKVGGTLNGETTQTAVLEAHLGK